jgi:hypothetical protein
MFKTEAEAQNFARIKFDEGLIVTAGTINPHFPRRAIPSSRIPSWFKQEENQNSDDGNGPLE